jgi:hypothetical protein
LIAAATACRPGVGQPWSLLNQVFFTTAAGEEASDKYHKSGFRFLVFRFPFLIFGKKPGDLASPTGGNLCF